MVSKKKIVVAVITATALSIGAAGTASAHSNGAKGDHLSTILSDLVKKGTLTQAQVDAINAAKETAKSAVRAAHDAKRAEFEALIAKTIGLDAAVIKTRLAAGETLGAIAGAKKDALIAALVADHIKRLDADVAAGKITAEQATRMKANLTARVTEAVNSTRGKGGKFGHKGGHRDGDKAPSATTTTAAA